MYIYKTTRNSNGKYYIGKRETTPENDKWYYGSGTIIQRIIKKDGKENLTKDILMNNINSKEELCYWEQFWITVLEAQNKEYGYNIANGGNGGANMLGRKHSEDSKKKMSLARIGTHPSEQTIINMGIAQTGRKHSQKTIEKLKDIHRNEKLKGIHRNTGPKIGTVYTKKQKINLQWEDENGN